MKGYVSSIVQGLETHGDKLGYASLHQPVWRGMSSAFISQSDYEPGKIGYWPTFSSTTKNKNTAISFSNTGGGDSERVLMKIYLSKENSPISHIDCIGSKKFYNNQRQQIKEDEYSFYPGEEEVLLFPYFGFLVVSNTKDEEQNIRTVTLQEIPMQDNLSTKKIDVVSRFRLIWVGSNVTDF
jgi:hypothetical protein